MMFRDMAAQNLSILICCKRNQPVGPDEILSGIAYVDRVWEISVFWLGWSQGRILVFNLLRYTIIWISTPPYELPTKEMDAPSDLRSMNLPLLFLVMMSYYTL